MFLIKGGYDTNLQKMRSILKTTLSKNPQVKVHQPFAIFVVEEDTLVVLVLLGMDSKRFQPLSQRRLRLKSKCHYPPRTQIDLGTQNFLIFSCRDQKRRLIQRRKKNHFWALLYLLNLSKKNLVKDFQKSENLSQIIHMIKL